MTQPANDIALLDQLRSNEQAAYLKLYRDYYPDLARFILRNSGNRQDAEDMFQETLLVLIHKIRVENFQLQSELKTFLFAVNRNQWLKKLRSRHIQLTPELLEDSAIISETPTDFEIHPEQQANSWIKRLFENITGHCVVLITQIFLKQQEPDALIKELGYKNAHSFQNQKYKCINQLRKAGKNLSARG